MEFGIILERRLYGGIGSLVEFWIDVGEGRGEYLRWGNLFSKVGNS